MYYFDNEGIYFGVNSNNELSSIQLTNISTEEIELIKSNF